MAQGWPTRLTLTTGLLTDFIFKVDQEKIILLEMQKCPHCSKENKIFARVCSHCMNTIGIEHKVKVSSVGNWVIVLVVVVVLFLWSMNEVYPTLFEVWKKLLFFDLHQ